MLKKRHDAEEQALRKEYSECWDQIHALQAERDKLPHGSWDEFNRIKAEVAELHTKKNALRAKEVALDHEHDVEMFECGSHRPF